MHLEAVRPQESGVALVEALVAMVVLAVGVMGLAALQTRNLVDTRTGVARANAVMLANDLAERMRLNRSAALADSAVTRYDREWNTDATSTAVPDCLTAACDAADVRSFDLAEWYIALRQLLPSGDARIDAPDAAGHIRVTFRWRNNPHASLSTEATAPLSIPIDGCQSESDQADWICHQVFIRP